MYVDIVPNRSSPPAILIRESFREDGRVRKRTRANLSGVITVEEAKQLKRILAGETLVPANEAFQISNSKAHGHVLAVALAMKQLRLADLLHSRSSRERDLVLALVAARIIDADTKLATSRSWDDSTLASQFSVAGAGVDELYTAMDWLIRGKERIEGKLAARHLGEDSTVMFDLTSTYVEGEQCSLAEFGYNRDKKRGKKQINWGLLTDEAGRPVGLDVFPGNTSDSKTLLPQITKMRERFGIKRFTVVGDRGMISNAHIKEFSSDADITWVTALKTSSLKPLVASGVIQPSLFEETNLLEFTHADYPGERLVACRMP